MFLASLQQTLLFLPLSLGLLLSYRITKLTDLTVETSFLTGSAIFVRLLSYLHALFVCPVNGRLIWLRDWCLF